MGHVPFQYPTPDGYPDEEGPWLGSLLWRWVFAKNLVENRIDGTRVDLESLRAKPGDEALMAIPLTPVDHRGGLQPLFQPGGLALMLASPTFQRC
jgi:hypothetical protein